MLGNIYKVQIVTFNVLKVYPRQPKTLVETTNTIWSLSIVRSVSITVTVGNDIIGSIILILR